MVSDMSLSPHDPPWIKCNTLRASSSPHTLAHLSFASLPKLGGIESPPKPSDGLEQCFLIGGASQSSPIAHLFLNQGPSCMAHTVGTDSLLTALDPCRQLILHGFSKLALLWGHSSSHTISVGMSSRKGGSDLTLSMLKGPCSRGQKQSKGGSLFCSIGLSRREIRGVEKMDMSHAEASLVSEKATIGQGSLDAPLLGAKEEPLCILKVDKKSKRKAQNVNAAFNTTKHLLAGAISAIVSRTFVAPLERLKLEYMVRGAQHNVLQIVQVIIANEGVGGFWRGNTVNLLRTAPFKAVNFFCFDVYRKKLLELTAREEASNFERLVAGASAGISATLLCFPMDTIRTRLVAPGGEALGGVIGCFEHMVRTEGFFSLYKGLLPSVISMAPSGAVFYGVYDILKTSYLQSQEGQEDLRKRIEMERARRQTESRVLGNLKQEAENLGQLELGPMRTLLYGAIAGICAETVTYPFEVVRRQLQMQNATTKLGAVATCRALVQKGGLGALYSGLLPSSLQVLPSAALSYFVYECMKIILKVS